MSKMKVEVIPCSATPLIYDEEKCIGCNACAEICQCDIILQSGKGKPPIVMFPEECIYCGACVWVCPKKGALRLQHPVRTVQNSSRKAGTRKLEGVENVFCKMSHADQSMIRWIDFAF